MRAVGEEVWKMLVPRPAGDRFIARPAFPDTNLKFYCAIDSLGHRHFLLEVQQDFDYSDFQSRGIKIVTRDLATRGSDMHRYVDLECLEPYGHAAFDLIGGEIAEELLLGKRHVVEIVKYVMAKWRRFWGNWPLQALSVDEQVGLFAELLFLCRWLFPKYGSSAVEIWQGPWGRPWDFEWSDKAVEVKATIGARRRIHTVHGIEQLDFSGRGPLYLFSVCLENHSGAVYNLAGLVDECLNLLTGSEGHLERFETGLSLMGYSPVHRPEYEKLKVDVLEAVLFAVRDDFPKITQASFAAGLPRGIEKLSYVVNLSAFDHLIVAKTPDEMSLS